ncbi:hypothetical protein SteCoe_35840 [Stentor coeruleus]|uniref:Uncharacterized protein n=1 Tax=Stentor coeruleus TaxID=5963 RepID=A0A1R2ARL7_9CILI|nr:hypothetical protein SteCoe_35840 [Stentor coeruleus]
MAILEYGNGSFLKDLFFAWVFKLLKVYKTSLPSKESFPEIPNNLDFSFDVHQLKNNWRIELTKPSPSFIRALFKIIWKEYLICNLILSICQCQNVLQAILVKYLIDYISYPSKPTYQGVLLSLAYIISGLIFCVFKNFSDYRSILLAGKIKGLISEIISEKVLKLDNYSIAKDNIEGKIFSVLGSDLESIDLISYTLYLFSSPLTILLSVLAIYYFFGLNGLIGISILIGHIPIIIIICGLSVKYRLTSNECLDERLKLIRNVIEGMQTIKLFMWENFFVSLVSKKRRAEVVELLKLNNLNMILQIGSLTGIGLAIYVTFYVHLNEGNVLELGKTYLLICLYFSSHINLVFLNSFAALILVQLCGIMKRIGEVLQLTEFTQKNCSLNRKNSILLKKASYSYSYNYQNILTEDRYESSPSTFRSRECLQNISVKLDPGDLLIITGPVGCGKSSFLLALLGEIKMNTGNMGINGSMSYASEIPWLISGSVKENIIMDRNHDETRYKKVIKSCALKKDLEMFKNSDETLVGDRGTTLSGGQKTRINLARAVYNETEIVLLDDPLSSVDPEVGNYMFKKCIRGLLKEKTVVLATHQKKFIPQADKILILENGNIEFFGTYKEFEEHENLVEKYGESNQYMKISKVVSKDVGESGFEKLLIAEEESEDTLKFSTFCIYLKLGYKSIFVILITFLCGAIAQVCFQMMLYWCSNSYKPWEPGNKDYYLNGLLYILLCLYGSVALALILAYNLTTYSNYKLHNKSFMCLLNTNSMFFDKNPAGRIINRFSKDVANIDGSLIYYIINTSLSFSLIFGSILATNIIVPYNTVILPFWLTLLILIMKYISPIISRLRKLESICKAPFLSSINSALKGLPTIRCLNLEDKFHTDFTNTIHKHYQAFITFNTFMSFNRLYCDLTSFIVIILNIIIIVSIRNYVNTTMAAYSLATTINVLGFTSNFSKEILELKSALLSAQRLLEYTKLPIENYRVKKQKPYRIIEGGIKFEGLSMRYQPELPLAIKNLTLEIYPCEKIGVVGRTGSGKSSIIQVLCKLSQHETGTIFIDGYDYKNISLADLREQISVIPQQSIIFDTSIRNNIDPYKKYTEKEIINALETVKLKDYIFEFTEGLDIEINGKEFALSAGQKQLLCICRAVLKKNKIILMDEATSNVDNETDVLIQEITKREFCKSTLIVIAHRLQTIINSDRILVMDEGECKDFDSPETLRNKGKGSHFNTLLASAGISFLQKTKDFQNVSENECIDDN